MKYSAKEVLETWTDVCITSSWRWGTNRLYVKDTEATVSDGVYLQFQSGEGYVGGNTVESVQVQKVLRPHWVPVK